MLSSLYYLLFSLTFSYATECIWPLICRRWSGKSILSTKTVLKFALFFLILTATIYVGINELQIKNIVSVSSQFLSLDFNLTKTFSNNTHCFFI